MLNCYLKLELLVLKVTELFQSDIYALIFWLLNLDFTLEEKLTKSNKGSKLMIHIYVYIYI